MILSADPLLHLVAKGFVIIVLARAVMEKVLDFGMYVAIMRDYRLLHDRIVPIAAALLFAAEVAAIACLLIPDFVPVGGIVAAALFTLYGAAIAAALFAGRTGIECGCGGEGQFITWGLVVRNAVLAGISQFCLLGTSGRVLGWQDMVTGLLAILVAFLLLLIAEKTIATSVAITRLNSNY